MHSSVARNWKKSTRISGISKVVSVCMNEEIKKQKGFTLIEVVVAIVIITALVATFASLIVSSVQRIQWAGQRTQELYTVRARWRKR